MTTPPEMLLGKNHTQLSYTCPMTCFTEIRLSQAKQHASRYGILGVGVSRKFALDLYGTPVHYVRNCEPEQVIGNVNDIIQFFKEISENNELPETLKTKASKIENYHAMTVAFMKGMSHLKDDFQFLEENEWRIVQFTPLIENGKIEKLPDGSFRIPINPDDIEVIVFPDDSTRTLALNNEKIKEWIVKRSNALVSLTLHECTEF